MSTYVLQVVTVGFLCGLVVLLFEKDKERQALVQLVCGLFLLISVMKPLLNINWATHDLLSLGPMSEYNDVVLDGERIAHDELVSIITGQTQAYILDKTAEWGGDIHVELELDDAKPPVPKTVTVTGRLPPYGRRQLQLFLRDELGIAEENQVWIY